MEIILFCVLLAIILNMPIVFHARHLRRLAEAKLEIARVVTEMEKLMLNGHIKLGELCHDKVYHTMLASQYSSRYSAPWKIWTFWVCAKEIQAVRTRIQEEVKTNPEIGSLLQRFASANVKAFKNNRPIVFVWFALWVLIFAGGLSVLMARLRVYLLSLIGIFTAVKAWSNFKKTISNYVADSYIACNLKSAYVSPAISSKLQT